MEQQLSVENCVGKMSVLGTSFDLVDVEHLKLINETFFVRGVLALDGLNKGQVVPAVYWQLRNFAVQGFVFELDFQLVQRRSRCLFCELKIAALVSGPEFPFLEKSFGRTLAMSLINCTSSCFSWSTSSESMTARDSSSDDFPMRCGITL